MAPDKYTEIGPQLFRGPRPTWGILSSFDPPLKTVIDLEPARIEAGEETIAQSLGIREIAIPMSSFWAPTLEDVQWAAANIHAPENRPCLVHCRQGCDRTGIVCAYYHVRYQGWSPLAAWNDALANGYHWVRYGALGWTHAAMKMLTEAVWARGT